MTTIVVNTLRAAVTEYDWSFKSITPTQAGSADGLFTLGGDDDAGAEIEATFLSGETQLDTAKKKGIEAVYFSNRHATPGHLRVKTPTTEYEYPLLVRAKGVARGVPGKGISENRLAIGYRNAEGADFCIDRMEADVTESTNRRL